MVPIGLCTGASYGPTRSMALPIRGTVKAEDSDEMGLAALHLYSTCDLPLRQSWAQLWRTAGGRFLNYRRSPVRAARLKGRPPCRMTASSLRPRSAALRDLRGSGRVWVWVVRADWT